MDQTLPGDLPALTAEPGAAKPAPTGASSPIETDAVIIGAGPVGLFQVFELGLLEIRAHVIDSLPEIGGQCVALYPDKPIYDIPALPSVSGQGLTDNLMEQIRPFAPTFHLGQEVQVVQRQDDGRFYVRTSIGTEFLTKTVFIAGGVGSFQSRELKLTGIDRFNEQQVFYRVRDVQAFNGKNVVVAGGGDSALDWALTLVGKAESVILVHRRDGFRAAPATVAKMRALCEAFEMQFLVGQVTGYEADDAHLKAIKVAGQDGVTRTVPLDALLVFYGLSPKLGPIADWGLALNRRQLEVDTEKFETSVPGIFAVGDINTYPGKKKLILCGFHEAALAAFGSAKYIFPDKKIHLQYTTTSTKLHDVLGVESPTFD
jgi:thioredoxin reductase (NADPH)